MLGTVAAAELLASAKELREAVAACLRVMAASEDPQLLELLLLELNAAGVKNGFGVRAQKAIAEAERR